jgi:Ca2+:H+ antiporter
MKLASEIAISSSAQVALLVTPAIMLLSLAFATSMPLTFRWEEITAMASAVGLTAFMIRDGRSHKWEGATLVTTFLAIAVWFWLA